MRQVGPKQWLRGGHRASGLLAPPKKWQQNMRGSKHMAFLETGIAKDVELSASVSVKSAGWLLMIPGRDVEHVN
jgi:hypothetical protein